MVAKITRLILLVIAIGLVGCQTVPLESTDTDTRRQANEPTEAQLPTAGAEVSGPSQASDASTNTESDSTASETTPTASVASEPDPEPEEVVTQLQMQALQLQAEGRWSEAELILERALRIDAEKVDLYHQLATVRMGQERFGEAEQIALKGLSLTDQTPKYKASLWEVIAQCRSAQGNIDGADEARDEMLKWMSAE